MNDDFSPKAVVWMLWDWMSVWVTEFVYNKEEDKKEGCWITELNSRNKIEDQQNDRMTKYWRLIMLKDQIRKMAPAKKKRN